jgi:hypothetical protein
MAQPDDFKLIRGIVAAGGDKKVVDELDRSKYQRLVELGWLKASSPNLTAAGVIRGYSALCDSYGRCGAAISGLPLTADV